MKLCFATNYASRLRGLLGRSELPDLCDAMLIAPCSDVHTFGMRKAIDVAFFDDAGKVLLVKRGLAPGNRLRCAGAVGVLERFSCESAWFEEGERIALDL